MLCPVCNCEVGKENWDKIKKEHSSLLNQVDFYGEDSLTEHQQVLYGNRVHVDCYLKLS